LKLGAVDFVTKPFSPPVLLNRVANHLHIDELIKKRTEQLEQRNEQIERLQDSIVFTLANIVESRDKITGGHIERTSRYIKILIEAMLANGVYAKEISKWDLDMAIASARLHDVGKIAVSDLILNKPEKLTPEEFSAMRCHVSEGESIINQMIAKTGDAEFLLHAKLFIGYHHERFDGKGYPRGLSGEDIPLQGRIMAIADVYDALVSERPYKSSVLCEEAEEIIKSESGASFDPKITDVFWEVKDKFREAKLHKG
jgi:putative two-component system response regulator